jgi:hypothetical protein
MEKTVKTAEAQTIATAQQTYEKNVLNFKIALDTGKITREQYNQAVAYEKQKLQQSQQQQAAPLPSQYAVSKPSPSTTVKGNWQATPEGYELYKVETYIPPPLPEQFSNQPKTFNPKEPVKQVTEYTYIPTFRNEYITGNAMLPRKITEKEAKRAQEAWLRGEQPFTSMEQQALTRLGATLTVATGVAVPAAGLVGVGFAGGAEGVKYATTQKHLTPTEAVEYAGIGTMVGVIGIQAAPYVKAGYNKIANTLNPERAMYNRVVLEQQVQEATSKSLMERFIGKVSPERAMYNRVINKNPVISPEPVGGTPTTGDYLTGGGGGGGAGQWVQQQVLLKQPSQKVVTAMKPFTLTANLETQKLIQLVAPTLAPKTAAPKTKTATKTSQRQVQSLVQVTMNTNQRQVVNPFLQYQGPSYYQKRRRIEEIVLPITYPIQSPLQAPQTPVSTVTTIQKITQPQLPKSLTDLSDIQIQVPSLIQNQQQSQKQQQRQESQQAQKIAQNMVSGQKTSQAQKLKIPEVPMFSLGGGETGLPGTRWGFSRWFPRKHNVKSWEKQLETIGFSQRRTAKKVYTKTGKRRKAKSKRRKTRRQPPRLF